MSLKQIALTTVFGLGFAAPVLADNPLSSYHYLADPAAFATDDEFYILTDTDDESPNTGENDYTIRSLYILSSKDMKNWTDHGMVLSHDREVSYIKNIWAPGIAVVDGVFYLIYPNGASGVGIVSSKNVAGPYHDPVGKLLVGGGGVTGCDGISWCFDPAIFIDEDGKSYMTFGGGSGGSRGYGNNFDLFEFSKLSYDKVELNVNSKTQLKGANRSFEASYLHKRNGTYYLSYNDQSQNISYATSKNIKGPYTYVGTVIENPSKINGKGGNNHHGFAKFKDKWYAVYHDRRLVMASEKPKLTNGQTPTTTGNHRSVSIDELTWNGDKMNVVKFTDAGPAQVGKFDPYQTYKALTSSKQRNVRSRTDYTRGQAVVHVLTPLATKESWIRVSGVDFGKGAENLRIKAANVGDGNKIEIHKGSVSGSLAGTCELAKTDGWKSYTDNDCAMTGLSGVVDELFFVFKGSRDSTMGILEWEFRAPSVSRNRRRRMATRLHQFRARLKRKFSISRVTGRATILIAITIPTTRAMPSSVRKMALTLCLAVPAWRLATRTLANGWNILSMWLKMETTRLWRMLLRVPKILASASLSMESRWAIRSKSRRLAMIGAFIRNSKPVPPNLPRASTLSA